MTSSESPAIRPSADPARHEPLRAISREAINRLPLLRYDGPCEVIRSRRAVGPAVAALSEESILGFDIECRPSFRKGVSYPPALLQLAGASGVYLFQLSCLGLPRALCRLLADPGIIKAGVALKNDISQLQAMRRFNPAGFVELATLSSIKGFTSNGLRGLAAAVLGGRISKKARTTNWAQRELTPAQIAYAATDAWASREICLRLFAMDHAPNDIAQLQQF